MDIVQVIEYARHPLVGAFTGYVTTDVAIRLLFRPLKPWRIFGLRIPLTPGVLPRKRDEFAEKIGKMVGSHLLTSADVKGALMKESFRRELQGAVNEKLHDLLGRELGTAASLFPPDFEEWLRDMADRLRAKGVQEIFHYLDTPAFERELQRFFERKGDELLARDLQSLLSPEQFQAVVNGLESGVRGFVGSQAVGKRVAAFADKKLEEFFASGVTFRQLIPAGIADHLAASLEGTLTCAINRLLDDPAFRYHLRDKMESAFGSALASLQGVSGFFAKLIDPARLLALFPELVEKLEQETLNGLHDEMTQAHLIQALQKGVDALLDKTVAEAMAAVPYRKAAALRRLARKGAVNLVRNPQIVQALLSVLKGNLEQLSNRSLGSLLGEMLSQRGVQQLRRSVVDEILLSVRSATVREALDAMLTEKIEQWLFRRPVGQLATLIPASARDELADTLYNQLAELLVSELPPLVEAINIQQIVEEKVNSLDILQMEGLLLDIMRESFMFLNLFGAFLGFLIGVANVMIPGFGG